MTIFYIIWFVFFLLSLVFAFIYLSLHLLFFFVFVLYFPYFRHWPNPTADAINLFCTTKKKLFLTSPSFSFLNFTFFFFLSLVFIVAQLPVNKEQTDKHYTNIFSNLYKLHTFSLSLLYYIEKRESVESLEIWENIRVWLFVVW